MRIYTFLGSENKKGKTAGFLKMFEGQAIKRGQKIVRNIKNADAVFIVTPTHWFSAPIKLKKFIDTTLHKLEESYECEGKFFGALVYAPQGGEALLLSQLALTANLMGFQIPPFSLTYYRNSKDKWALKFDFLEYLK